MTRRHNTSLTHVEVMLLATLAILPLLTAMPLSVKAVEPPQITLNPSSGWYDTTVGIHGVNFSPNSQVKISWETLSYWEMYATTGTTGVFDVTVAVPDGLEAGNDIVTAIDAYGKTASATFALNTLSRDSSQVGIKSAKQFVKWNYTSSSFFCETWKLNHNSQGGWYDLMAQDYGIYILRLTYGETTYVYDLAGGAFNAWPTPLKERVLGFDVVAADHIQGRISILDPTDTVHLVSILVDIYTPKFAENYYALVFTISPETELNDLAFYVAYNLNIYQSPNSAFYDGETESVYQYYGPSPFGSNIPEQYRCLAGFGSVLPASSHHDVDIDYVKVLSVANKLRDYNFDYRDQNEVHGDAFGNCAIGLQWVLGSGNATESFAIPVVFAASDENLESYKTSIVKAKLFCDQAIYFTPSITLGHSEGPGTDIVEVQGQSFMPFSEVTVEFGGVFIGKFATDSAGKFRGSFLVPTAVKGIYIINATDSYGLTASEDFEVVEVTWQWLADKLDALDAKVVGLVKDVNGSLSVLITTDSGNVMAKLNEINATLTDLSVNGNGEMLATINTTLGTITTRLTEIDAHVVSLIMDAKDGILARIDSKAGDVLVKMNELNATIAGLITDLNGELNLLVNTACGNVTAKLSEVNASIQGLIVGGKGEILANIGTALGNVTTTMQSIYAQLEFVNATTLQINSQVGKINVTVNSLNSFLEQINATVAKVENKTGEAYLALSADLGEIKVKLDFLNATLLAVKGGVAEISVTVGQTTSTVFAELSAIKANLTEIKGAVATIDTSIGTITTSIDSIGSEIVAFSGDLVAVKTSVGELQVSLDSLDGKITLLNGDLAAVQTSVGTIVGNITSIHEGIIEIETKLGSLTASTSLIQSGTNWQVLAIVLIEVAAISVVVFQTKIRRKKPSLQPPKAKDVNVD